MNITTTTGPVTTLAVAGEVNGSNYCQLIEAADLLLGAGHIQLILDLSGVTYISSAGLLALQTIATRAAYLGGTVVLCGPNSDVRHVLEMTGIIHAIGVYPDAAAAQAGLAGIANA
jgi:anti-sigma B factor antagonist